MSTPKPAGNHGYRRSAGTARGQQRRAELLERVTDDLAEHGLADFPSAAPLGRPAPPTKCCSTTSTARKI